jgi:hypothetical protein
MRRFYVRESQYTSGDLKMLTSIIKCQASKATNKSPDASHQPSYFDNFCWNNDMRYLRLRNYIDLKGTTNSGLVYILEHLATINFIVHRVVCIRTYR